MINFKDTNIPIIGDNDYWKDRTVKRLKASFDALKEAREFMIHSKTYDKLYEQMFQSAGKDIMDIAKSINGVEDKTKEVIEDAKAQIKKETN